MKLTLTSFLTLDGVVQAPGGPEEDRTGGFEYGGWLVPFADEEMGRFMAGVLARAGAFLLGRRTYEIFAGSWPQVTDPDDPIATCLNALPKHVVSTTLERTDWHNSTLLGPDTAAEVKRLKAQPGPELQIHGSPTLARSLMADGLIDEYNLLVYPVVLGTGQRLFPEGGLPTAFELTASRTTPAGVAIQTYRPAGPATFGSFGPEAG
ncbi:dihydrofolate reductase family protein [Streptomyces sp. NBC_01387]|uniref:dihydrofolate reductase family protein n=1 Tax=unclassified Streptomyces TaxID=2593676 RepID=UPI0020254C85|nr:MULTISPECIES: dihydrofolate reductase family protein [unclassified Streptomyces]MCX4554077.1 dihydrofolate reductase family protein [Streptomyces sp. NBC_01500]WSC18988.1 dihydrofolate reductase family protein [Streptomyces sp. NBC_01766]WSV53011.1 dihydrofolate reductase family protein [Streptomyces sp. NBC_01014]